MSEPLRCVNLDWFEIHCLEPPSEPHDADYFRRVGLLVNERAYGTRVYREMFTVCDTAGKPFVEVRRNPFSQGYQGIHAAEECHLRLVNAACYYDDAVCRLRQFLDAYGYQFNRISRADICLDFEKFDYGDEPARFLRRYLQHRYAKINQGRINAHGSDTWSGQEWNSVSWGASSSPIGTKFYNKTLELFDPASNTYGKPHIRYAWLLCGLVDDFHYVTKSMPDGTVYTPQIWRVEFSIRSSAKNWVTIELNGKKGAFQSIRNDLNMYDSREKLLVLFASLQRHYFHFKKYEENKRKDRCDDKLLFNFKGQQVVYKVAHPEVMRLFGKDTGIKPADTLLRKLREFQQTHHAAEVRQACDVLIRVIEGEAIRADMSSPWNYDEILMLRRALSEKVSGRSSDVTVIMREVKKLLRINDNTAIF